MPVEKEPSTEGRLSQQVQRLTWLVGASLALGLVTLIVLVVKDFGSSGDDAEAVEREMTASTPQVIASMPETTASTPEMTAGTPQVMARVLADDVTEYFDLRANHYERLYARIGSEEARNLIPAERRMARAVSRMLDSPEVADGVAYREALEAIDEYLDLRGNYSETLYDLGDIAREQFIPAERRMAKAISKLLDSPEAADGVAHREALEAVEEYFDLRVVYSEKLYAGMPWEDAIPFVPAERRMTRAISRMLDSLLDAQVKME